MDSSAQQTNSDELGVHILDLPLEHVSATKSNKDNFNFNYLFKNS